MDAASRNWEKFKDPSLWEIHYNVPIFPAGRREGSKVFDEPELKKYVKALQDREASGTPVALTIGHTKPGGVPQSEQPPIVGYALGWRLGKFGPDQKTGIIADRFFLDKKHAEYARSFPRLSPERWTDGSNILDPIALLRTTPILDMGLWPNPEQYARGHPELVRYAKPGQCVRYSAEEFAAWTGTPPMPDPTADLRELAKKYQMTPAALKAAVVRYEAEGTKTEDPPKHPEPKAEEQPEKKPPGTTSEGSGVEEELSPEDHDRAERYMKHYLKHHPHMAYGKRCYEAGVGGGGVVGGNATGGGATEAGAAHLSSTNGALPAPAKQPEIDRMSKESQDREVARYQREHEEMKAQLADMKKKERAARYEKQLVQMESTRNVRLDVPKRMAFIETLSDEQAERYMKDLETTPMERSPAGPPLQLFEGPAELAGGALPDSFNEALHDKAIKYQRKNPDKTYAECIQYARSQSA